MRLALGRGVALLALGSGFSGWAQPPELGPAPLAPDFSKLQESQLRTAQAPAALGSWFDVSNRDAVRYFYLSLLVPTNSVSMGWTGSVAGCAAGTTSQEYQFSVLRRINWFRAMAGVPAGVSLDSILNSKDQAAALMMSANRQLATFRLRTGPATRPMGPLQRHNPTCATGMGILMIPAVLDFTCRTRGQATAPPGTGGGCCTLRQKPWVPEMCFRVALIRTGIQQRTPFGLYPLPGRPDLRLATNLWPGLRKDMFRTRLFLHAGRSPILARISTLRPSR
jgi:hypothetical protein